MDEMYKIMAAWLALFFVGILVCIAAIVLSIFHHTYYEELFMSGFVIIVVSAFLLKS